VGSSRGVRGNEESEVELSGVVKAGKEKGVREAKNSKVDSYRSLRFKLAIGNSMVATKHRTVLTSDNNHQLGLILQFSENYGRFK